MTIEELRKKIGLEENQLLTNSSGEVADILDIDETHVTLGVLTRKDPIRIPIENILSCRPQSS